MVAVDGRFSRGGGADAGGDAAQLAIMPGKTSGASGIQKVFSVMGVPRFGLGPDRGSGELKGLSLMDFETAFLRGRTFTFEPASGGVGLGRRGALLGRLKAATRTVERVPAEPKRLDQTGEDHEGGDNREAPADRLQERNDGRSHGNTFRSSSKCGPSRSFGQSPPHTIAVP